MRLRHVLWAAPVVGAAGIGILANSMVPTADAAGKGEGDPKQSVALPIKQVVLFNSGVGYFGRTGEVGTMARSSTRTLFAFIGPVMSISFCRVAIIPYILVFCSEARWSGL